MQQVADILVPICNTVRVVDLPGLQVKGDVSDWLADGGDEPSAVELVIERHLVPAMSVAAAAGGALTAANQTEPAALLVVQADQTQGPLTPMQQRVLFVEQMAPGRVIYNVPSAHRLTGPLDLPGFTLALATIVARQPSLRTVIANADTAPIQQVLETVPVHLPLTDLSGTQPDRLEITLRRKLDALIAEPFDLTTGPLFKSAMFKLSEHEHVFFFMAHHLTWDGWSFDGWYEEMARVLGGGERLKRMIGRHGTRTGP